jgi:hypothetical protein
MPRAGFEPVTPATKRPQTYALDRHWDRQLFTHNYVNITGNYLITMQYDTIL